MSKVQSVINFIKKYFISITILFVLSIVGLIDILNVIKDFTIKVFQSNQFEAQVAFLQLVATLIAGTWAFALYYRNNRTIKNKYLKIYLEISEQFNVIKILTKLSNDTQEKRELEFACLIITLNTALPNRNSNQNIITPPELNSNFYLDILREEFNICLDYSSHIKNLEYFGFTKTNNMLFVPLNYYTKENLKISNEDLTYEFSFEKEILKDGIYDVRFFVFPTNDESPNMERIVHKSLIIKNSNNENNN